MRPLLLLVFTPVHVVVVFCFDGEVWHGARDSLRTAPLSCLDDTEAEISKVIVFRSMVMLALGAL